MSGFTAFLQVPLALPGLQEEITDREGNKQKIDNPDMVVTLDIIPAQVVAKHPAYYPGHILIYLANGQPFLLKMTMEQYNAAVEKYIKQVNERIMAENKRLEALSNIRPINGGHN